MHSVLIVNNIEGWQREIQNGRGQLKAPFQSASHYGQDDLRPPCQGAIAPSGFLVPSNTKSQLKVQLYLMKLLVNSLGYCGRLLGQHFVLGQCLTRMLCAMAFVPKQPFLTTPNTSYAPHALSIERQKKNGRWMLRWRSILRLKCIPTIANE